jgi:hypothetical protein
VEWFGLVSESVELCGLGTNDHTTIAANEYDQSKLLNRGKEAFSFDM